MKQRINQVGRSDFKTCAREKLDEEGKHWQEGVSLLILVSTLRDSDKIHTVPDDAIFKGLRDCIG